MKILPLEKSRYQGSEFTVEYETEGFYEIARLQSGFTITFKKFPSPRRRGFKDKMFNEWLEDPIAYGSFEGEKLLGFAEGFHEKWNNRFRLSNICVFDKEQRHCHIGSQLLDAITAEAAKAQARMIVLETQSCNEKAISFYRKNGFDIIGFDLYSYSNEDPEKEEVRIEMGKKI